MLKEKCGVLRIQRASIGYLRTHVYTYMRAQADKVAASMLPKFEHLHDVEEEYKKDKEGKLLIKNGKTQLKMPKKMMEVAPFDTPTLTLGNKLLETVLIKLITTSRFMVNSQTKMRVMVTKRDLMVSHAMRKEFHQCHIDGLARDDDGFEHDWDKIRGDMVFRAWEADKARKKAGEEHSDDEDNEED